MSGRWDTPGVPHRGWACVGYADLEEAMHTCEMCGNEQVRYVHTMAHPTFERTLDVGCVCAEKMECSYEHDANPSASPPGGPRERERAMKGRVTRRKKWCERSWKVGQAGRHYLRAQGCVYIISQNADGSWNASATRKSDRTWYHPPRRRYPTADDAKLAIFDALWPARVRPIDL